MADGGAYWDVYFYDFFSPRTGVVVEEVPGLGSLEERAVGNGARHGTPVIVARMGEVDARVNLFFRTGKVAGGRPSTWRRYAYALVVWMNFLHVFGRRWDEATVRDVEVFKHWRLTDPRNQDRVAPTTFDTDRAALNSFYFWASGRYGVANPVKTVAGDATRRWPEESANTVVGPGGRDPLRPAGASRRQVKWMQRPAFEQWRDIGLRGYGFDGLRRPGWRGACEDRDAAFVEGLLGTGLRLVEWASVLDVEIPPVGEARFAAGWLSAACIKGGKAGRTYRIPRSVLRSIAGYTDPITGSRAEAMRRAQRAGRYQRLSNLQIVTGYNPRSRLLYLEGRDGVVHRSLDVIGPDERRLLFRRVGDDLEPLALWLTPTGLPKKAHGWEDTFQDANARVADLWVDEFFPGLQGAERGRRREKCPLWCRPHMARHSFALKWYSILSVAWEQRIAGFTEEQIADLREQFGGIWFQLASMLGHRDPMVTRDTYLEPFTCLQIDYLMSLLDEEETAAVDALVRVVVSGSGRVLSAIEVR